VLHRLNTEPVLSVLFAEMKREKPARSADQPQGPEILAAFKDWHYFPCLSKGTFRAAFCGTAPHFNKLQKPICPNSISLKC
jgi:hypothetical protein